MSKDDRTSLALLGGAVGIWASMEHVLSMSWSEVLFPLAISTTIVLMIKLIK